jgi:hypothetical protein
MMIIWWSKHIGVILNVLMCDIWINVLIETSALVGPLYIVNWNARWNCEKRMCVFFVKRCKKPLSKLLDSPHDTRFGAEKLVLSATDENRFKVERMGRSPPPHLQANTKHIHPVKTKPLSPHLSWSTCRHLFSIKFRRSLNSNLYAAQTS